jgi:type III secretion system FlhB-like substrate exporter
MMIENEPARAIALKYDGGNAPTVTASGEGTIAD